MAIAAILARGLAAQDLISADDSTAFEDLIERVADSVTAYCNLPYWPDSNQGGYSESKDSPTEDISSLTNNAFFISVDGSAKYEIELTLANCTSGANTASEMQTQIRAEITDTNHSDYYIFQNVTVAYASSKYTVTSPTFGEGSSVKITFQAPNIDLGINLGLSAIYGGEERIGSKRDQELEDIVEQISLNAWRKLQLAPDTYDSVASQFAANNTIITSELSQIDALSRKALKEKRRFKAGN
jgi:hypothetical protein